MGDECIRGVPVNMRILTALLGVVIGLIYGQLMRLITSRLLLLTYDPAHPGPMIPDDNGWARLIAFVVMVIATATGILAAVVVALTRVNASRGALIGAGIGVGLFIVLTLVDLLEMRSWLAKDPAKAWPTLMAHIGVFFFLFPLGLGLVGLATGFITTKLKL